MKHTVKVTVEKNDIVVGGYQMISVDEPNNDLLADLLVLHVDYFKEQLLESGTGIDVDKSSIKRMIHKGMINGFRSSRDSNKD